jgi:hypothetical protein
MFAGPSYQTGQSPYPRLQATHGYAGEYPEGDDGIAIDLAGHDEALVAAVRLQAPPPALQDGGDSQEV